MDPRNLGERLEASEGLDRLASPLQRVASTVLPRGRVKDALHGVWLGHPLHPLLTDLPIGFWTSAWVLDMVGGRKSAPAARRLVGLGVASALPTAAAGLADWSELEQPERRSGAVHAVANLAATGLYAASYVARRRGRRGRGIVLGMAGAALASVGGYLGGHLAYRRAAGVNHAASAAAPASWVNYEGQLPLDDDRTALGLVEDTEVATFQLDGRVHGLADRCSHLGGPLHEGDVRDGCVTCPWHASTFCIVDGAVMRGPATATQPAYEIRTAGNRTEARRASMP